MPRPRRRLPSPRCWFWLGVGTLVALRVLTLSRADGQRDFSVPPLREGPCRVVRVISGDTLMVMQDEQQGEVLLRLLGVEAADAARDGQPLATEAHRLTKAFVGRGETRLVLDKHRLDERGRYLAYVQCRGESLNEALLLAGLARFKPTPGHSASMQRRLKEAEEAAQASRVGLWRD